MSNIQKVDLALSYADWCEYVDTVNREHLNVQWWKGQGRNVTCMIDFPKEEALRQIDFFLTTGCYKKDVKSLQKENFKVLLSVEWNNPPSDECGCKACTYHREGGLEVGLIITDIEQLYECEASRIMKRQREEYWEKELGKKTEEPAREKPSVPTMLFQNVEASVAQKLQNKLCEF